MARNRLLSLAQFFNDVRPTMATTIHERPPDDDVGGDDRVRQLPVYVRFRDISAAGIARNWPTLTRLIQEDDFPPGVMLSPNIRAWKLVEIEQWLERRPVERKQTPSRWGGDRIATT
jgi:predicted DNA-binding transcriptional regulator AlpA